MITFILYILFFIVLAAVLLLGTIARFFFRITGRKEPPYTRSRTTGDDPAGATGSPRYTAGKERKKIFGADDGEYVDFEEIKE